GKTPQQVADFYKESMRRIDALPGVDKTAFGILVPWRDAGTFGPGFQFSADGHVSAPGEEDPRAQLRSIPSGFFAALGVPIIAGAADIDDEHVVPGPTLTVYSPFDQGEIWGGRLFIHTSANPYSLVSPITKIIRDMSVDQPIERAATLEDVRAEVLTPDRLNTVVFGVFAGVALAIALVGVAGVLAFSVSARTRECGIRLALGPPPQDLLKGVVTQGAIMAISGVVAGAAGGYLLARFAGSYFLDVRMPSALPVIVSAVV